MGSKKTDFSHGSYGDVEYWEKRYSDPEKPATFEWYQGYEALAPFVARWIKKNQSILMVGCGNSRMSDDMASDGYLSIMNIDISQKVIRRMQDMPRKTKALEWRVASVTKLPFPDSSFDAAIDKGTLDAILCGMGSSSNASKMQEELHRVLKPGGVFVEISYGLPDQRACHFPKELWDCQVEKISKGFDIPAMAPEEDKYHFIYIFRAK